MYTVEHARQEPQVGGRRISDQQRILSKQRNAWCVRQVRTQNRQTSSEIGRRKDISLTSTFSRSEHHTGRFRGCKQVGTQVR
jgi:hypothetical protein